MNPMTRFIPLLILALPGAAQAPLTGEAYQLSAEAYRLAGEGNLEGAMRNLDMALHLAPSHPELTRFKIVLLVKLNRFEEADGFLRNALSASPADGELLLQRAFLLQRQGRPREAIQPLRAALLDPALGKTQMRLCRLTLADLLQSTGHPDEALDALDPLAEETSVEVQSRRGYALLALGHPSEAAAAFQKALPVVLGLEHKGVLMGLRDAAHRSHQPFLELKALEDLHALEPSDRAIALDLAYAQIKAGRDQDALGMFRTLLAPGSSASLWLDAAYAAKRSGRNHEAAQYFSGALDAADADPARTPMDPAQRFAIRRESESLSRAWGFDSSGTYRQGGYYLPGLAEQKVFQQGAELYYQPDFLTCNGRFIQVFAQVFENLWDGQGGTTGGPTLQGALGIRVKPISSGNLVLTAEKLLKLGDMSLNDWLLRLGYSYERGGDIKPWLRDWTAWSIYTEGASFVSTGRYVHTLEARWGHSWRVESLSPSLVFTPHCVLGGDYDSRLQSPLSLGVGPGVSLRNWFRQDRYKAPASWVDLSIQYRLRLTDVKRGEGLFLRLSVWL